jgi:hypothetical protein
MTSAVGAAPRGDVAGVLHALLSRLGASLLLLSLLLSKHRLLPGLGLGVRGLMTGLGGSDTAISFVCVAVQQHSKAGTGAVR